MIDSLPADELMERDLANLHATASDGAPRWRIYRFAGPSVTAGRNARVSDDQIRFWQARGHAFARRPTGGGILRHEDDLSFGVAFPSGDEFVAGHYRAVAMSIRDALSLQGVAAESAPDSGSAAAPGLCFAGAVGSELLYKGKKLVGLASRKIKNAVLVQGSITIRRHPDLDREILGAGPEIDLSGISFSPDDFAISFAAGISRSTFELSKSVQVG